MITNQFRQLMHNLSFMINFTDASDDLRLLTLTSRTWNMTENFNAQYYYYDTIIIPRLMTYIRNLSSPPDCSSSGSSNCAGVIFLNTPDVVITPDDYKITGNVLNSKLNSSYTIKYNVDKEHTYWSATAIYTLKNISSEAITITDICLSNYYNIMVDHTKLDEPLTLEPNETGEITYTIKSTCQLLTTESST